MLEAQGGWEAQLVDTEMTGGANMVIETAVADTYGGLGVGGTASCKCNTSINSTAYGVKIGNTTKYAWMQVMLKFGSFSPVIGIGFGLSGTQVIRLVLEKGVAVTVRSGSSTGTLRDTGTYIPPGSGWFRADVELHTGGAGATSIKLWIDGDPQTDTPDYTYAGADQDLSFNQFILRMQREFWIDEWGWHSSTMQYDTGTGGLPTVSPITDGTWSAPLYGYVGDATSGYLILGPVTGGTPADGDSITDGGTFAADVDAPTGDFLDGHMPHSSNITPGYVTHQVPNGNGNSSDFTGSDADSTDNYQLIDEAPIDTSDYVFGDTNGDHDSYAKEALPSDTSTVVNVGVVAHCRQDGAGITKITPLIRIGGTDYEGDDLTLPADWAGVSHYFQTHPDGTTGAMTKTVINNTGTEPGAKVKT